MDNSLDPNSDTIVSWFRDLQDSICVSLEDMDGKRFKEDLWERNGGGGGRTRVIQGYHIAKGGVNFSKVFGKLPPVVASGLGLGQEEFIATGVSIVLHPKNPWVPIIHMNVRYFEMSSGEWWFGGGIDMTPHYINMVEASSFHRHLKAACETLSPSAYATYKKWADDYFFNVHRDETRGIGGIFFDRLNDQESHDRKEIWKFVQAVGNAFIPCYRPVFESNYNRSYRQENVDWQAMRRARYVEFNLVYDRGTKFGLQTSGRIESILMSMPPQARWEYDYHPAEGSLAGKTQRLLKKDIDWFKYKEA